MALGDIATIKQNLDPLDAEQKFEDFHLNIRNGSRGCRAVSVEVRLTIVNRVRENTNSN